MNYKLQRNASKGTIQNYKKNNTGKKIKIIVSGILVLVTIFTASIVKSDLNRQDGAEAISSVYSEIVDPYDEVIKDIKTVLIEKNITSPVDIFSIFNRLLWEGYLSVDGKYVYANDGLRDVPYNEGVDIISGIGVCRQHAQMLAKLFNEFGYDAFAVNVYVKDKLNTEKQENIDRKIGDFDGELDGFGSVLSETYGNHQVVLLADGNDINFFDSTNLCVYKLDKDNKLSVINGSGTVEFLPTSDFYLNGIDLDALLTIVKAKMNINRNSLTKEEIANSFKNMNDLFEDEKEDFKKFHDSEADNMKRIDDALNNF